MKESKLKKKVFKFFVLAKLLTVFVIFLGWQIRGYTMMQMVGTLTMVLPLFTVYLSIMLKEIARNKYVNTEKEEKELNSTFVRSVKFVLPIYTIAIIGVIYGRVATLFEYKDMQVIIGAIESGFGGYVGVLVFSLFKEPENKKDK